MFLTCASLLTAENGPSGKEYPAHWGTPPQVQTLDFIPLPAGYGDGSSTLANWIKGHLEADAASKTPAASLSAKELDLANTGFYLDKGKWLAINPAKNKEASIEAPVHFADGKYHITLRAVGESDGKSKYHVSVNGTEIGAFTCPLSKEQFEEGPAFITTWKNIAVNGGDVIRISAAVGTEDGKEFSRARWASLDFVPADEATRIANAKLKKSTPAKTSSSKDLVMPRKPDGDAKVVISGERKQWHKVSLTLDGPFAAEMDNAPNPFTDYNFTVTFTHSSGSPSYKVPGYFAADGNAHESSASDGTKWRANFSPDSAGIWVYTVSFTKGKHAALGGAGSALAPFDGVKGSINIAATDKSAPDFRAKGRLEYVGKHYLQFAGNKEYFIKVGADAPETFLAYIDFDNTIANKKNVPLKTWAPHLKDWKDGDPTWKEGKGKAIIGALNYLSAAGANAVSFLPYNAGGDGDNIWPFVDRDDKMHYDCSKLDQWTVVLDHSQKLGLYLHFKTQENENDDSNGPGAKQSLDGGDLGPERKLYYRELVARFGHELALNWNFGEENTQSADQQRAEIAYVAEIDPYQHLRVIHTYPQQQDKVYGKLLGSQSLLTGASLQNEWNVAHQRTLKWVTESASAGTPWVVANDEQGSAAEGVPPDPGYQGFSGKAGKGSHTYDLHDVRKYTLWGTLMAGGQGVEYYFGYKLPQNDLIAQDYRSRDKSWRYAAIAIDFFRGSKIPFWEMTNANSLIGNHKNDNSKYCLAKKDTTYLVYLPEGGSTELDLSGTSGDFKVSWFNPRTGGAMQSGPVKSVKGGGKVQLGNPPTDPSEDWAVIITK
ncbi:MAG: DUF5060 domain-containing protein [Luteolibacter sp.]